MASIHTTDIIGMKKYPANYTKDLIVVLEALSYTPSKNVKVDMPVIYGSASVKMSSPSDYDSYINVDASNISYLVNGMKEVIKNLMDLKGAYIADIKCGNIDELQVIPDDLDEDNYMDKLSDMLIKLKKLYTTKKIDKTEYNDAFKFFKDDLNNFDIAILKHAVRFNVARWTPEEILKGYIIRRGYKLTLEKGFQQNALTKIDVISFSVNRYPEISMVYLFKLKGKTANISFIGNDREVLLQNTIPPLIYEDKFFKVCKRIFALERYREKPNLRVLEILMKLFNSDLGRLYQIVVDLNTTDYMFDNYSKLDMDKIKYMLDQIRFRTSNFVNKKYDKVEYKLLDLLGKFQDDPLKHRKELDSFKDQLFEMMNTQTKEFLDINRLLPIPAEYLPYKTENKEKEKRNAKNTSKLIGKGEMTKYINQELLEDNDMLGAGGIPSNTKLYETIKKEVFEKYPKHSAYRSMLLVKEYKKAGGTYTNDKSKKMNTKKWLGQNWTSLNDYHHNNKIVKCGSSNTEEKFNEYPVCRPLSIIKKLSHPQMKKLIDEKNILKNKTLKTSKILNTNEYNIKDTVSGSGINYKKMNLKDLITEHKKLIGVLEKGTPKQRIAEALEQYHELQGYLKDMK